ncbi:unnamed protein product [Cuscuta campestris]|uniref:BHLH domain-containing protein n=1 Tax=Cuscuta campestris TaxID=132261 RepID=A0A484M381_9ASTE|nr:unnamed protein product [Cuscuta campestris]
MAGNPNNWWSTMVNAGSDVDPPPPPPPQSPPSHHHESPHFYGPSVSLADEAPTATLHFPRPFNQLIMDGLGGNENEKFGMGHFQYKNNVVQENWENHQIGMNKPSSSSSSAPANPDADDDVIKEDDPFPRIGQFYNRDHRLSVIPEHDDHHRHYFPSEPPVLSSPPHHHHDHRRQTRSHYDEPPGKNKTDDDSASRHSYESNSTSTGSGGATNKKARVHNHNHHSSTQPSLKVRKEKLGDRITALHQLVSPFGKTDTASVLSEVIGYVTFLHSQIQALSAPYFGNAARRSMANIIHQQSPESGGDVNKDLRSKGLCLVPLSCTDQHVISVGGGGGGGGGCTTFDGGVIFNNGGPAADYWPPLGGGGF